MYNMDNEEIKYHEIISKNIKKLRTSAKYSQEEMAEKLSCSREFISRVENRKEKISLNNDKANIDKIKKVKKILKNINKDVLTEEDIAELIKKIEVYENCIHIYYNFKNMETDIIPV